MNSRPPPFADLLPVSDVETWKKILSGDIAAFVYSSEARGDFGPVPVSAAEFFLAEKAGPTADDVALGQELLPFQIMWRDRDGGRSVRVRRIVPVPHWVYVKATPPPATKKQGPGAPEIYDWDDIEQFVRKELRKRGDFAKPENRVSGWRSQNALIEIVKDYLEKTRQPVPGPTQLKEKVADMLKRIRLELPTDH